MSGGFRPSDLSLGHALGLPSLSDSIFWPPTIPGNRITDFAQQAGSVGVPIPFGYGVIVVDGNVIWVSDVTTKVKKKKQGKGGVKTEQYTYTRSYAIAFAQGEIFGYLSIMRNGKVVYTTDPRTTVEDRVFADKWAQTSALYLGTRTQNPDSTIEAVEGAGNVSGFRDLAYIVVEHDDVTDQSGAVPSYQAIILASAPAIFMTSRPYAIEDTEALGAVSTFPRSGGHSTGMADEAMISEGSFQSGVLDTVLITYPDGEPEALDSSGELISGEVVSFGFIVYEDGEPEALASHGSILSGILDPSLISYEDGEPEALNSQGTLESGSLT